jgi:hypothetical protein
MLHRCVLRKDLVYLPTVVNQGIALYMDVEPVTVVSVTDTEGLRRVLRDTIPKENPFVAPSIEDARRRPILLKYTGDKSWPALMRKACDWSIKRTDGTYEIAGHHFHEKGYWEEDPEQTIEFPPETTVDDVVERMIAILQNAAKEGRGK